MANKYPYVASGGPIFKTVQHLRRSFPKELSADTLRKLGVAPNNESYVINVLRFLGVIDGEGKKVADKTDAFVQHEEAKFQSEFRKLVADAYAELLELHSDAAWKLDRAQLIQFFRTSDHSTEIVGGRQAGTFVTLASLAGEREGISARETKPRSATSRTQRPADERKAPAKASSQKQPDLRVEQEPTARVGLTVRVEVNLPAGGDQETYDAIFKSIRAHLIDGA